jgi:uncharacterized protein YjdB
MRKKILAILIIAFMLISLFPITTYAVSHDVADGQSLDISTGVLTHSDGSTETYTISVGDTINVDENATATLSGNKNVLIVCGDGVHLTLDNVDIDVSAMPGACALTFNGQIHNKLYLIGSSVLKSGSGKAGISDVFPSYLDIYGPGSIDAYGGDNGAGIGGGNNENNANISIYSGTVNAYGGENAAGIGSGNGKNSYAVTIHGGTVNAVGGGASMTVNDGVISLSGGQGGAGIGGGKNGSGGYINIEGGSVTAGGGKYGAGIGAGDAGFDNLNSVNGGNIQISGGTVNVKGGIGAAGIGGGSFGDSGTILIKNSIVSAHGGDGVDGSDGGAGIGAGDIGNMGTITIEGDTTQVTAYGGDGSAGIGSDGGVETGKIIIKGETTQVTAYGGEGGPGIGGSFLSKGTIKIESGIVVAHGGKYGAGIGGGDGYTGGNITIFEGNIIATGGDFGAGIGGGASGKGGTILIKDGTISAQGGSGGAGIGGGDGSSDIGSHEDGSGGNITISGGEVNATGGDSASGIGGGNQALGGSTTITGGEVNATGGSSGAGIGGGDEGAGGQISISGGTVIARSSNKGAGIGGGDEAAGGTITILGSSVVNASGGTHGAGIGGGEGGDSGTIKIEGGNTTATGGSDGAGIGGGYNKGGESIEISGGSVCATGGDNASGIGGGYSGSGGTITLSGGNIFAEMGASGNHDIGSGKNSSAGSLEISGDVAVFIENDKRISVSTSTHTHFGLTTIVDGELFGLDMPIGWTQTGAYIIPLSLTFNANGGVGTPPDDITLHITGMATAPQQGSLANGVKALIQWNTDPNEDGYGYYPGINIITDEDMKLYAIWGETNVQSVSIDMSTLDLAQGDRFSLTATVSPQNADDNDVLWYSGDIDVAVVDQSGNIEAVGEGSASIVAYAGGARDTCVVTVTKNIVTKVTVKPQTKTLSKEEMFLLGASITPGNVGADIIWTSSDNSVVTVSRAGIVKAVGAGSATVTASADGESDICQVSVPQQVTAIALSLNTLEMQTGQAETLTAGATPADAENLVEWNSTDTGVASVDQNGSVTALSKGTAVIIAKANGVFDVCIVTVSTENASGGSSPIKPHSVEHDEKSGTVKVTVHKDSLPEGTQAVKTPDGSIVKIENDGTASFEVPYDSIGDNGQIKLAAHGQGQEHLADVAVQVFSAKTGKSVWDKAGPVLLWTFVGLFGAGIAGLILYFVLKRR